MARYRMRYQRRKPRQQRPRRLKAKPVKARNAAGNTKNITESNRNRFKARRYY